MTKSFPCPYCKGAGEWVEPVTDYGQGPVYSCSACDGQGMIEINGPVHQKIRRWDTVMRQALNAAVAKHGGDPRNAPRAEMLFLCSKCEEHYAIAEPTAECPVCGWRSLKSLPK